MRILGLWGLIASLLIFQTALAVTPLDGKLSSKLQRQWLRYQAAQNEVLSRNQQIDRTEWEKILELPDGETWTPDEIASLRGDQRARIQSMQKKYLTESVIDLQGLRSKPDAEKQIQQFCAQVPKGGMLHIHPSGTLNRQTVLDLLTQNNPSLEIKEMLDGFNDPNSGAFIYPEELKWLSGIQDKISYLGLNYDNQIAFREFMFLPPGKHPFPRFNAVFWFLNNVIGTWADYEKALLDFANRAAKEGVIYLEFSTGLTPEKIAIIEKIEKQTGILVRTNRSFARSYTAEELAKQAQDFLQQPGSPYQVGIDFLDNEEGNPALEKGQLLYAQVLSAVRLGKSQLHRTMHAGELGDIRNPRDAMILGAERLGHGLNLNEDAIALEYAAEHQIGVEINLVSNMRLTKLVSFKDHPFLDYLRLGIPVSLSTDDEGIFDTDIQHECEVAVTETDISYAEFKKMSFNSIETSFASDADKSLLKEKLTKAFVDFEAHNHTN
jgi:adenosine deaminase